MNVTLLPLLLFQLLVLLLLLLLVLVLVLVLVLLVLLLLLQLLPLLLRLRRVVRCSTSGSKIIFSGATYWQKSERTVKIRSANDPQRGNTTSGKKRGD